ncbi:MAG: hypothetical protein IKC49_01095 [Clostridia bacterium]|nr:hypothetical protein [Clostridia bacterium]
MSDKEKRLTPKWLEKLKKIKHIEIYIAIIFVIVLLLIYLSNFQSKANDKDNTHISEMNVTTYIDNLESDLEEILSNIGGVSDVRVLITLDMAEAEVKESKINLTKFPSIKGVLVTAKGVNDTTKKLKLLHAIESIIDISSGKIEILSSN